MLKNLFLNPAFQIIIIICSSILFLLLAPVALICGCKKSESKAKKILFAGKETSNNLRQMTGLLVQKDDYEVFVTEFSLHPFFQGGFNDEVVVLGNHRIPWNPSSLDIIKCQIKRMLFLIKYFREFDVVVFNWTDSFLPLNLDYVLFRICGTSVFVRHCGSDVRYAPLQDCVHRSFGIKQWQHFPRSTRDLLVKLLRQQVAELFATGVISTRDHATFQLRPLFCRPYIQMELPRSNWQSKERKLILHAPSDPALKGTETVVKAIEMLSKIRSDFDFVLLEKATHDAVLQTMSQTCILIDQPGAVPARLATEGFASGCVVVGGNIKEIHGFETCPSVQFVNDALILCQTLHNLLSNGDELQNISEKSVQFWKEHCSDDAFLNFFEALLVGKAPKFERVDGHEKLMHAGAKTMWEKLAVAYRYLAC